MDQGGERQRCFGDDDPIMADYHDQEWGVPVHDDRGLFEHLTLDIFQAGLSWRVILHKRPAFREAFAGFEPEAIQRFDDDDVARLLQNEAIVRNRAKIEATINNARAYVELKSDGTSFSNFLWGFTGGETIKGPRAERFEDLPTKSPQSEAMTKGLKELGFRFVGPTICYAFMQAVGMIDDHLVGCFKFSGRP